MCLCECGAIFFNFFKKIHTKTKRKKTIADSKLLLHSSKITEGRVEVKATSITKDFYTGHAVITFNSSSTDQASSTILQVERNQVMDSRRTHSITTLKENRRIKKDASNTNEKPCSQFYRIKK